MSDAAHIHMNKIRVGVVSDSTIMQRQREIAEFRCPGSRQANVDRHSLHMQAMQRNPAAMDPQVFIAPGRTISADYIDLGPWATRGLEQLIKKIEHSRVVVAHFSRPVITEKMIEFGERGGDVGVTVSVHDIQLFTSVCMKES
jgi:hypothetical protein